MVISDPSLPTRRWRVVFRPAAWAAVVVLTAWLVRAEVRSPVLPDGVRLDRDIPYRKNLELDLYRPSERAPAAGWPVIVALHGGGWRGGTKGGDFGRMVATFAEHGYAVASVDYTLSRPGAPSWPA